MSNIFDKMYYIYTEIVGIEREGRVKTIGYIYAVILKVYEKSLTVEEAIEMIREIVAR